MATRRHTNTLLLVIAVCLIIITLAELRVLPIRAAYAQGVQRVVIVGYDGPPMQYREGNNVGTYTGLPVVAVNVPLAVRNAQAADGKTWPLITKEEQP